MSRRVTVACHTLDARTVASYHRFTPLGKGNKMTTRDKASEMIEEPAVIWHEITVPIPEDVEKVIYRGGHVDDYRGDDTSNTGPAIACVGGFISCYDSGFGSVVYKDATHWCELPDFLKG